MAISLVECITALNEGESPAIVMVGFEDALIGLTIDLSRVIYDVDVVADILMENEGMTEDEAAVYIKETLIPELESIKDGNPPILADFVDTTYNP